MAHRNGLAPALVMLLGLLGPLAASSQARADDDAAVDQQVQGLIQQLGDAQFSVRQRAQGELVKLGFAAFDALTEAQGSEDAEIREQSRYLVRLLRVDWVQENDPPEVKQILKDFDAQPLRYQLHRINQLAWLPDGEGVEWLCRLARFEQMHLLSKYAALAVVKQDLPADEADWEARAKIISKGLDRSTRPAAQWLKAYVQAHGDQAAAAELWGTLADAEQDILREHPKRSRHEFVVQLLQRQVDALDGLHRDAESAAVLEKMVHVKSRAPVVNSLYDLVEWLTKRQAWNAIDQLTGQFRSRFESNPVLMYRLAQTRLKQGRESSAKELGDKALSIHKEQANVHLWLAYRQLVQRGLTRWADQEFEHVIRTSSADSQEALLARHWWAQNLHDRQEDAKAAAVCKVFWEKLRESPKLAERIGLLDNLTPQIIEAQYYFLLAEAAGRSGDQAARAKALESALDANPMDVDVLIAVYHLPNLDPDKKKDVLGKINVAAEKARREMNNEPDSPTAYNEFAWLIANTEGDLDEALRDSHKSIEIFRTGEYLDTLGRCYYAKGDYENAVRYQTEATRYQPHMEQIGRQLELFRKALADQKR